MPSSADDLNASWGKDAIDPVCLGSRNNAEGLKHIGFKLLVNLKQFLPWIAPHLCFPLFIIDNTENGASVELEIAPRQRQGNGRSGPGARGIRCNGSGAAFVA